MADDTKTPRNAGDGKQNPPSPVNGVRVPYGRPKGSQNKSTRLAQAFASSILDTEEYKESLLRRIRLDTLAPAVEVLLHHYKYGKPKDTVEVVHAADQTPLDAATAQELAAEASQLATEVLAAQQQAHERARAAEREQALELQRQREEEVRLIEAARLAAAAASEAELANAQAPSGVM